MCAGSAPRSPSHPQASDSNGSDLIDDDDENADDDSESDGAALLGNVHSVNTAAEEGASKGEGEDFSDNDF